MTSKEADTAHNTYCILLKLLPDQVKAACDAAKLNEEQRGYVIDKLHDELRFWRVNP